MSYILGVLFGDGYINTHKNIPRAICLSATDKGFVKTFYRCLSKCFKNPKIYIRDRRNQTHFLKDHMIRPTKIIYVVRLASTSIAKMFVEIKNNYQKYLKYLDIPAFLRGFYDSEGCVHNKRFRIECYNSNKEILLLIKKYLNLIGIRNTKIEYRKEHNCYILRFCGKKQLKIFNGVIGFSNYEKKRKLESLIKKPSKHYKHTIEQYKKALELRKQGMSYMEIAKKIGVENREVVWRWVKGVDVPGELRWSN